ncbi:cell division protein ZapA [Aestuariivirga litoralis]|uniref:cell division protein ZapA n=1 Tax=Aestuariivirga litoralis TaxID=2650924 RepID=UPI0018C78866|nr:cell division protein ZapA [Aestuariivirga litoralis]MBG1232459.1 cell division protein ZapA [Aestuariivirga litoralis]
MANVVVTVADRPYTMQCPDGEEEHLRELAQLLDAEVGRIKQNVGSIGDIRLLVMSGLMVADRLSEAVKKIESLEDQVAKLREGRNLAQTQLKTLETNLTTHLDRAAVRLEGLAKTLGED